MPVKLYYEDSHLAEFTARVLTCGKTENGFAVTLDRTAFFPEGGGQSADTGVIGGARVLDAQEKDGEILHYTDAPLTPGETYACRIDWAQRFSRMQNHSGEHIVSGLVHKLYGYDNVGFHMGAECVTIDFNGELTGDDLAEVERLANEAVTKNLTVTAAFPTPDELAKTDYRSKKELLGAVRLVTIEGVDVCACCAPHVTRTGEIGAVKFLGSMRHRGGVRIDMVSGGMAYEIFRREHESVAAISAALSAKQTGVCEAVERLMDENGTLRLKIGDLARELVAARLSAMEYREGNICIFDSVLPEAALRELVNGTEAKCSGIAAAFSGSDASGWRYIIGSESVDLRAAARTINAGIGGRGGGTARMIQGSATKSMLEIRNFLNNLNFRQISKIV